MFTANHMDAENIAENFEKTSLIQDKVYGIICLLCRYCLSNDGQTQKSDMVSTEKNKNKWWL